MTIPRTRRAHLLALGCLLVLVAAGCAVGPDYEAPEPELPDAWQNAAAADVGDSLSTLESWWTALGDTLLDGFIIEAREANPDLIAAVARIREARAYRAIAGGDRWPQVGFGGEFSRSKQSEYTTVGAAIGGATGNNWEFGLGASWELDLFGRIRRAVEATDAQVEASIEDYRDVLVSLYAQVASTYIGVRSLQARVKYTQDNISSQRETLDVVTAREDAGLVPLLDVSRARSNLATTEASLPLLESNLEAARNSLAILLGKHPGSLDEILADPVDIPKADIDFTVGVPAELLRRRPDVRGAERRLAAQTARIGVATADLYPSFSIAGVLKLEATEFSDLGNSGALGWALAPGVQWNLFSGGKIRGQIAAEKARTEQTAANYDKVLLAALAEVETNLVRMQQEGLRLQALQIAVESSQQSVELVHTLYLEGLTEFQVYLDAQRDLTLQQDSFAASAGHLATYVVDMNRALGGGWSLDDPAPDLEPEPETVAAVDEDAAVTPNSEEVDE